MTELRRRMIRELQLRRLAPSTQEAYVRAVAGLAKYYGRSPEKITGEEVKGYLLHLINERGLGYSSVNVASAGIRFLYAETLGRSGVASVIPPRRTPRRLPQILSAGEIERLLEATANHKHRTLLMTAYGAGLRVSELVSLELADIDSSRMMIRVRSGKGDKDRYTILSPRLLQGLRHYWRLYRPDDWLFPGGKPGHPMTRGTAAQVYNDAKVRAGITKTGGIHTLRHCFATHLLEAGVDLSTIQILMGHSSIRTTAQYLHLTQKKFDSTPCLLELINPADMRRSG